MMDRFFRPFFGGIFLDRSLTSSSRMFDFVFRMLSLGSTSLPAQGMGAITEQLAARLPPDSIFTGRNVASVAPNEVVLESGEKRPARAVVVASEGPEAARLVESLPKPGSRDVTCLYFAAERAPVAQPILVLNGEDEGPVNNLCVPSTVAPAYAPAGQALVSVTVLEVDGRDEASLEADVRRQLEGWFGDAVRDWRHLRTYRIAHALPDQTPPALEPPEREIKLSSGLFVCGDHRDNASINGAMVSGHRTAEAVLESTSTLSPLGRG
jgi:phytoene dehydrogenase-like protein